MFIPIMTLTVRFSPSPPTAEKATETKILNTVIAIMSSNEDATSIINGMPFLVPLFLVLYLSVSRFGDFAA